MQWLKIGDKVWHILCWLSCLASEADFSILAYTAHAVLCTDVYLYVSILAFSISKRFRTRLCIHQPVGPPDKFELLVGRDCVKQECSVPGSEKHWQLHRGKVKARNEAQDKCKTRRCSILLKAVHREAKAEDPWPCWRGSCWLSSLQQGLPNLGVGSLPRSEIPRISWSPEQNSNLLCKLT